VDDEDPSGVTIGGIWGTSAAVPGFTGASYRHNGTFAVIRSTDETARAWTVNYVVGGTATPGADYAALGGSVVIPAGETTASILIAVIPDALPEGDETITITLLPGTDYGVAPPSSATASITDQPIDAWRASRFTAGQFADPTFSGDSADPDGDGIRNLSEYALGLNPLLFESSSGTVGWDVEGHLTLTYLQRSAATDVTTIPEGSVALAGWSSATDVVEEIARLPQGEFDQVTVRLRPATNSSGFLRIRVTRP